MYKINTENDVKRYDLNHIIELFCDNKDLSLAKIMNEVLQSIAKDMHITKISFFQFSKSDTESFKTVYPLEISENSHKNKFPKDIIAQNWSDKLFNNECVNQKLTEMTKEEQIIMNSFQIKSILIIPIFIDSEFWGIVTCEDKLNERFFETKDIDMLRSVSRLCVNAMERIRLKKEVIEKENNVIEEKKRIRFLTESSPIPLILFDENLNAIDCNNAALKTFECTNKKQFLNNYWTFSPEYQPDGTKSLDKALNMKNALMETDKLSYEWLHKTVNGELLPIKKIVTRMIYDDEVYYCVYKYDLRNIKKYENRIQILEDQINYDALTGIYNRAYYDDKIKQIINDFLESDGGNLSIMMIDVDNFKLYNDTYGHDAGDNCLNKIADCLSNVLKRGQEFVARYGGEEFIVVLPNCDEKSIYQVADKLLNSIRKSQIIHEKNDAYNIATISIGVATCYVDKKEMVNYENLKIIADRQLYLAKHNGRNQAQFSNLRQANMIKLLQEIDEEKAALEKKDNKELKTLKLQKET